PGQVFVFVAFCCCSCDSRLRRERARRRLTNPWVNTNAEACRMRPFLLIVFLIFCIAIPSLSQVSVVKTAAGWELGNGHVRLELARSAGTVKLESLSRVGG